VIRIRHIEKDKTHGAKGEQFMELDLSPDLRKLGYVVGKYTYQSPEARSVHDRIMLTEKGELVLWDVANGIRTLTGKDVKIKPRSVYRPEMLRVPLLKYFTGTKSYEDKSILARAYSKVRKMFYVGKLTPRRLGDTEFWPTKSAAAPSFKKKGEVFDDELKRAERLLAGLEKPPPVVIFQRGKDNEVVRPVFAYPMSVTLLESRFFFPYQDELLLHRGPYMVGRRYSEIAGSVNEIRLKSDWVLEMDYSGFDGSISSKLIGMAFDIIRNNFTLSKEEDECFDYIARYFVTCPVVLPGGDIVYGKKHGVPSGSMFTQMVDSIVNALAIEYACMRLRIGISRFYILGDDSVIGGYGSQPSLSDLQAVIAELGINLNLEKSSVRWANSTAGKFLGHNWSKGVATRPLDETFERLVCPERPLPGFRKKDADRVSAVVSRIEDYGNDNLDAFGICEDLEEWVLAGGRRLNAPRRGSIYMITRTANQTDWFEQWYSRLLSKRNSSRIAVHL